MVRKPLILALLGALAGVSGPGDVLAQDVATGGNEWLSGEIKPPAMKIDYDGDPITMRVSSFLSPAIKLVSTVWEPAFKRLEEESGGKIKVKTYYGGTLHSLPEGFKAVREGITDFTHCMTALDPGHFEIMSALTAPFLFNDASVATMVAQEVYPQYLKKEYEAQGVYLAHITMTPPYNILSKKETPSVADFVGQKVRIGGGLQSEVIAATGAVPLDISSRELFTAYQTGVIDGVVFHDAALVSFRAAEVGGFRTDLSLLSNSSEYCLSKKFFDGLPPSLKPVLDRWMQELAQAEAQVFYDGFGVESVEQMKGMGVKTVKPSAEQMEGWHKAVAPAVEAYVARMKKDGHDADALIKRMSELAQKYAAMDTTQRMKAVMDKPVSGIVDY